MDNYVIKFIIILHKKQCTNLKLKFVHNKTMFNEPCTLYQAKRNRPRPGKRKSAQDCCDEISSKYNTTFNKYTDQHYIQIGSAGESPPNDHDGETTRKIFEILLMAYKSQV